MKLININKNYLSEEWDRLPSNCLLDKSVTGCGGTTVELTSSRNSIILVPTIELVKNKQSDIYFGLYGKVKQNELESYLNNQSIVFKKIICTYDSFHRVLHLTDFFLLIDEYHILFTQYKFRNSAISTILKNFKNFEYCFMTATPITEENQLEELKGLNIVKLNWSKESKVNFNIINTRYIYKELLKQVSDKNSNYHIFFNSVKSISDFIPKLNSEDYKIVCSKSTKHKVKIGSTTTLPNKYNFYTSTCFEGCDIYDKFGKTIIICDSNISTTMLDILTLVRQICGRLRDSVYKNEVTIILNTETHRYAGTNDKTFEYKVKERIKLGESVIKLYEKNLKDPTNNPNEIRKIETAKFSQEVFFSFYVNLYNGDLYFDNNLVTVDRFNYKLVNEIYNNSINVISEYNKISDNVTENIYLNKKEVPNWIIEKLIPNPELNWDEIKELFKKELGVFTKGKMNELFPEYTKKQKTKSGVKKTYYKFII